MTKTQQSLEASGASRFRGPVRALAAFAAVLAVSGLYFAFGGSDGQVVDQATVPTPTTVLTTAPTLLAQEDYEPIGPGTYFVDADGDPSTTAGATIIINNHEWIGSRSGVNFNHGERTGVSMHLHLFQEPFTPVCGGSGVTAGAPLAAGSTAADLADGFAASGFTVLEAPAPVSAFGHDGYHVVVQVPEGCQFGGEGTPHIWIYPDDVIEVWSFDIDGSIVMVEALWLAQPLGYNGPEETLAELRAVIDSLVLTP